MAYEECIRALEEAEEEHHAALAALDAEIRQREAEARTIEATAAAYRDSLPPRSAADPGGAGPRQRLAPRRNRGAPHPPRAFAGGRTPPRAETREAVATLEHRKRAREVALAARAGAELTEALRRIARLAQDIAKARQRERDRTLPRPRRRDGSRRSGERHRRHDRSTSSTSSSSHSEGPPTKRCASGDDRPWGRGGLRGRGTRRRRACPDGAHRGTSRWTMRRGQGAAVDDSGPRTRRDARRLKSIRLRTAYDRQPAHSRCAVGLSKIYP